MPGPGRRIVAGAGAGRTVEVVHNKEEHRSTGTMVPVSVCVTF